MEREELNYCPADGSAGVSVCARKTDWNVGNHKYVWDHSTNSSCGYGSNSRTEWGPSEDYCERVMGSEGLEKEIMEECYSMEDDIPGIYFPGVNDCHDVADDSIEAVGLDSPRMPRTGPPNRFTPEFMRTRTRRR